MMDETRIKSDDLVDYIVDKGEHHQMEDFERGDIDCRIKRYGYYDLGKMPISSIKLGEFAIDKRLVVDIAKSIRSGERIDPIVYDPEAGSVIDGNHRANAFAKLGMADINAWIGDKSTYDDEAYHDCMAEKFPDSDEWKPDADEYGIGPEDE
jgi:hypothetical protein